MDPSNNFSNYRAILKASFRGSQTVATAAATDVDERSRSLPGDLSHTQDTAKRQLFIPFFSLLVKDLYFLNEGCANR